MGIFKILKTKKKVIFWSLVVVLMLLLALGLRLNFVLRHHQVPVAWDAAGYHLQAKEFFQAFKSWPDRPLFRKHFYQAYKWALPKCELYPLFLSGIYLWQGIKFPPARVAQAILGTINCLLLYLIAAKVFNRRVALLSLLLAALYIPFILSEGRLLTETLAIFVLLLTNWLLLQSLASGRCFWIFLAGFSTAFLVISRTFFQYIFIFYWPVLLLGLAVKKVRWSFLKSLLFILGFALVIGPRLFWTPKIDRQGRPLISGSWRNGLAIYCGVALGNQGFMTDADPTDEILRKISRENRDLSTEDRYLKAYLTTLLTKPGKALPIILSKGYLSWQRAYNDFSQSYILSPAGINIFNRIVLVLGLFGLCALLEKKPVSWPFLITCFYIWMVFSLADHASRYTLPVMPFMIAAGVWIGEKAIQGLTRLPRRSKRARLYFGIGIIFCCFLFFLSIYLRPSLSMMLIPKLSLKTAYCLWVTVSSLAILLIIPILFVLYGGMFRGWRRFTASILPPVIILVIYLSALGVHPTWHQWKIRLQDREQRVRQTIYLPDDLEKYRSAELKIDMVSGPGRYYDLVVKVEGEVVRRFEGGLTGDRASYIAKRRAFPIYLREQKINISEVGQWYTVPLDITKLKGKKAIEVEIQFIPRLPSGQNYVELYGDSAFASDQLLFEGPTFSQSPGDLSILKYLIYDDFRLWRQFNLEAPVESRYSGRGQLRDDDLSPQPGIQSGRYRIFLLLSQKIPTSKGFPVAVKSEDYITRQTHQAKHFMQVWEVNPWKRKSNRMLLEAAHAAPGEKGGFRLVAYADSDGDGKPDSLIKQSPYFTAEKAGEWSSWDFETEEKRIFVGLSWPKGSQTTIYYERALWPDDIFPEVMYYTTGRHAAIAGPVITNMRLTFLEKKK